MPDATPVVPASGALATLPDVGDTRRIEWPPDSGVYADYTLEEQRIFSDMIRATEAGALELEQFRHELGFLHDAKALLDARVTDMPGGEQVQGYEPVPGSPFQVPSRAADYLAIRDVADACEHCGLFSCSGECQDDDGSAA